MKNQYEIRYEVTALYVYCKGEKMEALIDTEDLQKLINYGRSWRAVYDKKRNSYRVTAGVKKAGKQETIYLHRFITKARRGMVVDHRNHNGLDNRKNNLREVTKAQNAQNRKGATRKSKTGVRGVTWREHAKKYQARAGLNGSYYHVGYFDTVAEAEEAITAWRKENMKYSEERGVC